MQFLALNALFRCFGPKRGVTRPLLIPAQHPHSTANALQVPLKAPKRPVQLPLRIFVLLFEKRPHPRLDAY